MAEMIRFARPDGQECPAYLATTSQGDAVPLALQPAAFDSEDAGGGAPSPTPPRVRRDHSAGRSMNRIGTRAVQHTRGAPHVDQ